MLSITGLTASVQIQRVIHAARGQTGAVFAIRMGSPAMNNRHAATQQKPGFHHSHSAAEMAPMSDSDIVAGVGRRQHEAEAALAARLDEILRPSLCRLTTDRELRRDLPQETYLIVLQRLREQRLRNPSRLSGYIYRTALFLLYAERRRNRNRPMLSDAGMLERMASPDTDAGERIDQRIVAVAIEQGIERLGTERDRELVKRAYLLDQDKEFVRGLLDLTPRHYDRVVHRARKRLADILRGDRRIRSTRKSRTRSEQDRRCQRARSDQAHR